MLDKGGFVANALEEPLPLPLDRKSLLWDLRTESHTAAIREAVGELFAPVNAQGLVGLVVGSE